MKRLSATLMLVTVLLLSACSSQSVLTPTPTPPTPTSVAKAGPSNPDLILATTTSTQDSGLLDVLVPDFEKKSGYVVKTIAVGTGAALAMGKKGDADVLLVHAPSSEMKLIESGDAVDRRLIMHNDFVFVGPKTDPAHIRGTKSASEVLRKIMQAQALFMSRGDNSGTNKKELALWKKANLKPKGSWYQQTGQGMGATLQIASEKRAYTLTDRSTYLHLRDKLDLEILSEGDPLLKNVYHVMVVNPKMHKGVNVKGATAFADYLTSPETQKIIGSYGKKQFGQPLFFPDAGKGE